MDPNHEDIPTNAGVIIMILNAMARQLSSSQEKRGDDKLELAHEIMDKFKSVMVEDDKRTTEDKIFQ
jgi:hypothetical protein